MKKSWKLTFTIALVAMGLMLSMQYKTQQIVINDLSQQKPETLVSLAQNLYDKQRDLMGELFDLQNQLETYRKGEDQEQKLAEALNSENLKLQIANGSIPVTGPGIVITLGSEVTHEDIVHVINELWNSAAEGIAVNGIRYNNYSVITQHPQTMAVVINRQELQAPYIIEAIGDPATLERGILIPGGVLDELRVYFNVPVNIEQVEKLVLPAVENLKEMFYAQKDKKEAVNEPPKGQITEPQQKLKNDAAI